MPSKPNAIEEKAITNVAPYIDATVTTADWTQGRVARSINYRLWQRVQLVYGPANLWARLNAIACASQRVRLYRSLGPIRAEKPMPKRRRKALASGQYGSKIADWVSVGGEVEEITDHPVLDLLNRPNPWWSGYRMSVWGYWCREATGNSFLQVIMGKRVGHPTALLPMTPEHTTIEPDPQAFIGGYTYGRESAELQRLEPEDVLHFRLFDGVDPYYGDTWVTDVAAAIEVLKANYKHQQNFIERGYLPPFGFEIDPKATPDQIRMAKASLDRQHAGVWNWTGPLWLQNAKLFNVTSEPVKYQTREQLDDFRRDIRNAAGVPESMADVNDANVASARVGYDSQYLGMTVAPRVSAHCVDNTEMLLPLFGEEPGVLFFAPDEIVPGDRAAMLNEASVSLAGKAFRTVNEVREEMGYEPIEGGDELERPQPPMFAPRVDGGNAAEVPEGTPEPVADEVGEDDAADDVEAKAVDRFERYAGGCCDERRAKALNPAIEAEFERALSAWFRNAGLTARIVGGVATVSAEANEQLREILAEYAGQFAANGALDAAAEMGNEAAFVPPAISPDYVVRLASEISDSTTRALTDAVRSGMEAGDTITGIQRRIVQASDDLSGYAANRVARTESTFAYEQGVQEQWRTMGVERKEWMLAANACPLCAAFFREYGGPIPIDQAFVRQGTVITYVSDSGRPQSFNVWRDVQHPPLHPNCRCGSLPVLEDLL